MRCSSWASGFSSRRMLSTASSRPRRGGTRSRGVGTRVSTACQAQPARVGELVARVALHVPAELKSHRRQQFLSKQILAARAEALEQRRTQYGNRRAFIDRRFQRPAPLARVTHATLELAQLAVLLERIGGQV